MSETRDGGPAYPVWEREGVHMGMSLLDQFAGEALNGMLASEPGGFITEDMVVVSWNLAEAMIAERAKRRNNENGN